MRSTLLALGLCTVPPSAGDEAVPGNDLISANHMVSWLAAEHPETYPHTSGKEQPLSKSTQK